MSIFSILPALLTILFVIATDNLATGLIIGIITGSIIAGGPFFTQLFGYFSYSFFDYDRIKVVLFIMSVGILIKLITISNTHLSFSNRIIKKINSPRKARLMAWILSLSVFFDDYANVLITGTTTKEIFKKHKLSPAMLAYIINTIAGISSIIIISTWSAYEISLIQESYRGIKAGASENIFFKSLPYHFYTYFSILLTLIVTLSGRWLAYKFDNRFTTEEKESEKIDIKSKPKYLIISILVLFIISLIGISAQVVFNIPESIYSAIDVLLVAILSSVITLIITFRKNKIINTEEIKESIKLGIKSMSYLSLVIFLAGGISKVSIDIGAGTYITNLLKPYMSANTLPLFIFLISILTSVATGFSWSSMALIMPIAYQLIAQYGAMDLIPITTAAVISGSIAGSQSVPYSNIIIMSATAVGISTKRHTATMLPKVLTVIFITIIIYLLNIYLNLNTVFYYIIGTILLLIINTTFAKK